MIQLLGYTVPKIEFRNNINKDTQLQLKNNYNHSIDYIQDHKICLTTTHLKITAKDNEPFNINIEFVGQFAYENEDSKETIHSETFAAVFPFLRQIVANLTSTAGTSTLIIPQIKLLPENVHITQTDDEEEKSLLN